MNEDQTVEFVKNSMCAPFALRIRYRSSSHSIFTALALAMSRDGSSGGCIRMVVIKQDGVRRVFIPGDKLPR